MLNDLRDPKLMLFVLVILLGSACTSAPSETLEPTLAIPTHSPVQPFVETSVPTPQSIRIMDGYEREVAIPASVQRIITIAPSSTEILFAVGAGSKLVGRDEFSDYPSEVEPIPSIGSTYGDLNTEAIVALEPDLVIAAMINSPEHVQAIEDLGITVFVLPNPSQIDDLYGIVETAGKLTGHVEEATALAIELKTRVEAVLEQVADVEPKTVYFEVDGTDPTSPWTLGSGTFQNVLIEMAGGVNIAADLEGYALINPEELVVRDPQIMIFSAGPWLPTTPESVAERPGWGEITAVSTGAVYGVDTNWIDRPGPRIVDALEAMAKFIHPERFKE